ncbi:phosphoribosylformylglycinamidine synthase 1 [Mycobacterium ulcerans str. Harvey]|uniref:Phosphoribosylformylglycinamidine synthase 1 n=1 Tax=Mycobacterium ulcerans str. Harvey TaxID=1299332 RepID=A0ABN0RAZ1_MYCUL|nr:phosphoribosylformylglycinamidine synthase 1 [Mycobacterium ulcerans str. Harvey]
MQWFPGVVRAGLLPGALTRNVGLHFVCRDAWLRVASTSTAWTSRFEPAADLFGAAQVREAAMWPQNRCSTSWKPKTGWCSATTTMSTARCGTSPDQLRQWPGGRAHAHPEHAIEALTGPSDDGLGLFYSALDAVLAA